MSWCYLFCLIVCQLGVLHVPWGFQSRARLFLSCCNTKRLFFFNLIAGEAYVSNITFWCILWAMTQAQIYDCMFLYQHVLIQKRQNRSIEMTYMSVFSTVNRTDGDQTTQFDCTCTPKWPITAKYAAFQNCYKSLAFLPSN